MKTILLTAYQTDIYNDDDDRALRVMLDPIREMAQQEADRTGQSVEIQTADGIVVCIAESRAPSFA